MPAPFLLAVQLSGRCNLSCAYCYQDRAKAGGSIAWSTLRRALDAGLALGESGLRVEFTGGEPLLEPDLLREAVAHLDARRSHRPVELSLTTNGTLLTDELLEFLVAHDFTVRLSFDGDARAQALRGRGTFATVDRLLDEMVRTCPARFLDRLFVGLTVTAGTVGFLADGVRYLVGKGLRHVGLSPRLTFGPDWRSDVRAELERQVAEIVDLSATHWRRTGTVPVGFLARAPLQAPATPAGDLLCATPSGASLCVTTDGRAWACPFFAATVRTLPPLAAAVSTAMDLGDVGAPDLGEKLAALPAKIRRLRIFTDHGSKRSAYGACSDCPLLAECHVCPGAISEIPGNRDPDLVPDFVCAFNLATLAARKRFDELTAGEPSAVWYGAMRQALHALERSLAGASDPPGSADRPGGRRRA